MTSPLPPDIAKIRDELAVKHADTYIKPETTIVQSCISEGDFRAGFNACAEIFLKREEELEQALRFCAGMISGIEGHTDKHPMEVLEWIKNEVAKLKSKES